MERNYTVNMFSAKSSSSAVMTRRQLHHANFGFDARFTLSLPEGELYVEKIVRIIPQKRIVAFGMWQDKFVVAKLFFDSYAKRNMDKDKVGIEILREQMIPTPALLYAGVSADRQINVLLFERIHEGQSLAEVWRHALEMEEIYPILKSVIIELATQHVLGVLQQDLHLKNFLLTEKIIYTLDGGQIKAFPPLLPKPVSMQNLALFLSQLGVGAEKIQEKLFRHYAKLRGWLLKKEDVSELFLLIKQHNDARAQQFEKKIFRECSDFSKISYATMTGMYDRQYAGPEFVKMLQDPDVLLDARETQWLKKGRSSTVGKVTLDGREFVIKRYNMKNVWHRFRRSMRVTRAAKSWRLAQKLYLFGVPTAKPAAFIEKKWLGLRSKSYYVTEYVSGEHLAAFFARCNDDENKIARMIKRVMALLRNVTKLDITHGDLKITNILIDACEQPLLIDLDGAREHLSRSGLRRAWQKEMRRFLANFNEKPALQKKLHEALARKAL